MAKVEKEYMKRSCQQIQKCEKITNRIECLEDEDEKDVLMYRYTKLHRWIDISDKMQLLCKRVHYIHDAALHNFII